MNLIFIALTIVGAFLWFNFGPIIAPIGLAIAWIGAEALNFD